MSLIFIFERISLFNCSNANKGFILCAVKVSLCLLTVCDGAELCTDENIILKNTANGK